jgi:hypothetical protein
MSSVKLFKVSFALTTLTFLSSLIFFLYNMTIVSPNIHSAYDYHYIAISNSLDAVVISSLGMGSILIILTAFLAIYSRRQEGGDQKATIILRRITYFGTILVVGWWIGWFLLGVYAFWALFGGQ